MSYKLRVFLFIARRSWHAALRVRDWSGILCERSDNGASKDIAESPTAELKAEPERPRERPQDYKSKG